MRLPTLLFAIVATACGGATASTNVAIGDPSATIDTVQVNGPLRLEMRDMPVSAVTPPFGPPTVAATAGAILVSRLQFGSLCQFAVTGSADVRGNTIGLHVVFAERFTVCTADVRVLQYRATLSTAPGTYAVAVIHERNNIADTLTRQTITVP